MPGMECVVMDPDTKTVCPPAKDPKNPTEQEQGELCYRGEWPAPRGPGSQRRSTGRAADPAS
eukprot:COSAG01_NODE_5293_length_4352_cov_340.530684_3_plen_62_part_00